ncbi:Cilia- and flagella-associated protein 44 [Frankliniella fusca]|uniref:Cilia- and flagella-associated protein 44 n=1 Tax=Frankliniella fusca TaxID=407009 RepID=A0AAE1H1D1_9NEOP|nr:Cilia- and flagella-associated protein 44 [Frankliniella fusca]
MSDNGNIENGTPVNDNGDPDRPPDTEGDVPEAPVTQPASRQQVSRTPSQQQASGQQVSRTPSRQPSRQQVSRTPSQQQPSRQQVSRTPSHQPSRQQVSRTPSQQPSGQAVSRGSSQRPGELPPQPGGQQQPRQQAKPRRQASAGAAQGPQGRPDGGDESSSESGDEVKSSTEESVAGEGVYDEKDFVSGPWLSENCTVPADILEFQYSFGYDCQVHSNLCVLDPDTLAFISGDLIHFFRVSDKKLWFRRNSGGVGLGHIAKNPAEPHFAVGERGKRPKIIVYEWPTMKIVALLRQGAQRTFTFLNYRQAKPGTTGEKRAKHPQKERVSSNMKSFSSPHSLDGDLLCSMAGAPDNFFTVWDWRSSRIMLRAKSAGQDVFNAAFSNYMPGHITSAGSAHVRFWRMAETFTGLKLEGAQGRFGNTEVTDVVGVLAMPDGKVVSGCEWGNILVWEAGLIKCEVTKKGRKGCHAAPVAQLEYSNGELLSLGMDGFVKVWYFETIDLADPPDEDRFVEVEPIFELEVADELGPAALLCMQPRHGRSAELQQGGTWFAQDGGGGLWQLDLSLSADAPAPRRLFTAHARGVAGVAVAPLAAAVATLGQEGRLHVYSPAGRGLAVARTFPAAGCALLWLPASAAACGLVLVLACADGVLRVVAVDLAAAERQLAQHGGTALGTADHVTLLQAAKAHAQAAKALALADDGQVLASGGADRTVFLFRVEAAGQFAVLAPIGFVMLDDEVTYLTFKPGQTTTLLAGLAHGQVSTVQVADAPTHNGGVSYRYKEEEASIRTLTYKSVKSQMRREGYLRKVQRRKERKIAAKRRQLEKVRLENPGLDIDEEAFLADSEPEEELEPLFVPSELGAVRWARYAEDDNDDAVWLSVTGYDAGYLYKYRFDSEDPVAVVAVPGDDDLEVSSFLFCMNNKYLFLGMGDGSLRCVRVKDDPSDLSDYWRLGMHRGPVVGLALSPDNRTLYSAGQDGNLFMYAVHPEGGDAPATLSAPAAISPPAAAEELYGADVPTLEDQCAKSEQDRKMKAAAENLQRAEQALWGLADTYNNIVRRNRQLPASQQIPQSELELDPRITPSTRLALEAEADLLRRKLAFPLEKALLQYRKLADFYTDAVAGHGIRVYAVRKQDTYVETIRQRKLKGEFAAARALVLLKQEEALQRGRTVEREVTQQESDEEIVLAPSPAESFLRGLSAFEHKFNARLRRLLDNYHSRKYKRERRKAEWAQFMRKKPNMDRTDPHDEELIREAEQTIGDYKLKSDEDYKVPAHKVVTTVAKYEQLLRVREQLDELVGSFNAEVVSLRRRKADLRERMAAQAAQLARIHLELPPHLRVQPPEPPALDMTVEYPERQYEISEEEIEAEMDRAAPSRRQGRAFKSTMELTPRAVDPELEVLRGQQDAALQIGEHESLSQLVEELVGAGGSAAELQRVDSEVDMATLRALGQDDAADTAWERELRAQRLVRRVWEQRRLVDQMERDVDAVDAAVGALAARRIEVQRDATLLRHHLLVLHQELVIIKACEEREETLAARVADKEMDCREVQSEMNAIQNKLDGKARDIVRCQEKEKELQHTFMEAVGDNQFVDYLKKIFKKKYRPPRASDAESSDETTSSSSSDDEYDDEEGASLESNEIGAVRFDDTACPPGCSEELFALALRLRAQRHESERDVVELHKDIEQLRRELEQAGKRLEKVDEDRKHHEKALADFRQEKQKRLNQVETLVVLKLSQLQHSKAPAPTPAVGGGGNAKSSGATQLPQFELLKNTLVFNTAVLADLDRRKQQLDDEAKAQRAKHKKNRTHLHRMVVDVRFMRERLRSLREQIVEAQYRKFGCVVDMTELEQALLKRFIWDLRSSADEIRTEFLDLIDKIRADVRAKFEEYKRAIEQNTERQNLLLVLLGERNRLRAAVARQERLHGLEAAPAGEEEEGPFDEDVATLQAQLRTLTARRDALLAEAVRLRQKGPLPPLPPLVRPGSGSRSAREAPTAPGPSAYHTGCAPEPVPPPPGPWPPACVTALKYPMYLGGRPAGARRDSGSARGSSTARSLAARRDAVRDQLAAMEDGAAEVRHPHPLQRRSMSLDSVTPGPGFLRADMTDIPAIPSEEELLARGPRAHREEQEDVEDHPGDEANVPAEAEAGASSSDDADLEELWRRASSTAERDVLGVVDGFLERLESQDGDATMMQLEERGPIPDDHDADDAEQVESDADAEPNVDDGIELVKAPTSPRPGSSDEDADQS